MKRDYPKYEQLDKELEEAKRKIRLANEELEFWQNRHVELTGQRYHW